MPENAIPLEEGGTNGGQICDLTEGARPHDHHVNNSNSEVITGNVHGSGKSELIGGGRNDGGEQDQFKIAIGVLA